MSHIVFLENLDGTKKQITVGSIDDANALVAYISARVKYAYGQQAAMAFHHTDGTGYRKVHVGSQADAEFVNTWITAAVNAARGTAWPMGLKFADGSVHRVNVGSSAERNLVLKFIGEAAALAAGVNTSALGKAASKDESVKKAIHAVADKA